MSIKKFIFLLLLSPVLALQAGEPVKIITLVNGGDVPENAQIFSDALPIDGILPMPLDRIMLHIRRQAGNRKLQLQSCEPAAESMVMEFNRFAASKIFAGQPFDRLAERREFITAKVGTAAAPFILEYFRQLERSSFAPYTIAGYAGATTPLIVDFYSLKKLDEWENLLISAINAAENAPAVTGNTDNENVIVHVSNKLHQIQNLHKELAFFRNRKANIIRLINEHTRIFRVNRSNGVPQRFTDRFGDPATVETTISLRISDDGKALIMTLIAFEPAMDKRRITGTIRDYDLAWKDDRFEIFIVPNPDEPEKCVQFIITSGGVLWDGRREDTGYLYDLAWNSPATLDVKLFDDRWEATLVMPWQSFGLDDIPDKPFLANIYRAREVSGLTGTKYSAWSPVRRGSFFQPDRFGIFNWEK
ncbi:MAG: hypothetical protein E7053_06105 [Lentisphaerae bacterium]|nr:hypothetical protein [Lentisphaerota bacterium]